MIGRQLSHYRILEKRGQGGMGEVYLAEDTKLDRKVALKLLPDDFASDPARIDRFRQEGRALAALDHPNIVTVYSVEEADGKHFLTMGLVQGRQLGQEIPADGLPLAIPSDVSAGVLTVDPRWKPLRSERGFDALVERFSR